MSDQHFNTSERNNNDSDGNIEAVASSSSLILGYGDDDTTRRSSGCNDTTVHDHNNSMKHRIHQGPPMKSSSLSTTSTAQVSASDGTSTTTTTMDMTSTIDEDFIPRDNMMDVMNDNQQLNITTTTTTSRNVGTIPSIMTTLPNGETMNAKNTLQSFIQPTVQPIPSSSSSSPPQPSPPTTRYILPNGQPINAKNTLYSFAHDSNDDNTNNNTVTTAHQSPSPPFHRPYNVEEGETVIPNPYQPILNHDDNTAATMKQEPVLPNGEMITSKNTLRSFEDDDDRYISNPQNTIHQQLLHQYGTPMMQQHPPPSAIGMPIINQHGTIEDHGTVIADVLGVLPIEHNNNHQQMVLPLHQQQQNNNNVTFGSSTINPSQATTTDPTMPSTTISSIPLWLQKRSFRSCVIVLLVLVLIGIVSVVVSINASNESNTTNTSTTNNQPTTTTNNNNNTTITTTPSMSPMTVPSVVPTILQPTTNSPTTIYNKEQIVTEFINYVSLSNEPITMTGTSTESKALQWMVTNDPLIRDTPSSILFTSLQTSLNNTFTFRIQQRFVLLLFWFQDYDLKSQYWNETSKWLIDPNECNWYGITCYPSFDLGIYKNYSYVVRSIDFYDDEPEISFQFKGRLPNDIGLLQHIQAIDFSLNFLLGTIPESIGQLTDITSLDLSYNDLTGTIPESIGQLTNMKFFDVRYSLLNGTIPDTIAQWTIIEDASFNYNNLIGSIPSEICNVTTLYNLQTDCNIDCGCCTKCY